MMAIGEGLGLPLPLVAGAVLSGAYFGDKLSPLSDSTVLASSLSKVEVITHVRAMLYLSVPAYLITAVLFTITGFIYGSKNVDLQKVEFLKLLCKTRLIFIFGCLFRLLSLSFFWP